MRGLARLLILAAALVPAAAWAHCCCDHPGRAHYHARKIRSQHVERVWRETGYTVVTNRRCNNFPRVALRDGVSGVTWLDIRVGDDGWTRSVQIRRSSGYVALDRASVACARGWYFQDGPEWQQARVQWWVGRPG